MVDKQDDDGDPAGGAWHLDKRVPVAMIVSLAVQTCAIVWWASSMSERVNVLERDMRTAAPQADRLTRVEVKIESIQDGIGRIERFMQQSLAPPAGGGRRDN